MWHTRHTKLVCTVPANTIRWPNVGLMLGIGPIKYRCWCWNIIIMQEISYRPTFCFEESIWSICFCICDAVGFVLIYLVIYSCNILIATLLRLHQSGLILTRPHVHLHVKPRWNGLTCNCIIKQQVSTTIGNKPSPTRIWGQAWLLLK